jgi:hypothetical protein
MRKSAIIPSIIIVPLLFLSCQKEPDVADCFKSTGKITRENRVVSGFNKIELHDNVNLFLTQDSTKTEIIVEAGENLIKKIKTDVDNRNLVIRNSNTCNWVRDFEKPINVYVTTNRIDSIVYRSAGDLTWTNAWTNDSVQFDVWEGSGKINLLLNTMKSRMYIHYGTVELFASGTSQVTFLSSKGFGPVNLLDLRSTYFYMSTHSPNDCYVYVTYELGVEINNIGNVYYAGHPWFISSNVTSKGRLIKLD